MRDDGGQARRFRRVVAGVAAAALLLVATYAAGWSDGRRAAGDRDALPDPIVLSDLSAWSDVHRSLPDPGRPSAEQASVEDPDGRFAVWMDHDGPDRVLRVFGPTGEVVELRGSLHEAGPDELRITWLSAEQRGRVSAVLRELLAEVDPAHLRADRRRDVRAISIGSVLSASPDDPHDDASALITVVDGLFDLSTVGAAEVWEPWWPDRVTAWVRPATTASDGEPVAWPLEGPVLVETEDVASGPTGEPAPYRCLVGDEAAAVFALRSVAGQGPVVVTDGGETYEVRIRFEFPYHVVDHHPCGGG